MATSAQQIADLQRENNQMYKEVAQAQMDFQREMSNTAHVRETKDLIAAGLNPVLSAGAQGASTPNGAQADVDAQSMVSYLINEMNNENAERMNSAQVAAQKYAAEMSYKAAQTAAWAQVESSKIAAASNPLGWITQALSDPNSPSATAFTTFMSWLGIPIPKSAGDAVTVAENALNSVINGAKSIVPEYKLMNSLNNLWKKPQMDSFMKQNASNLWSFFKQIGYNKLCEMINRHYGWNMK